MKCCLFLIKLLKTVEYHHLICIFDLIIQLMKYFTVFLFSIITSFVFAQNDSLVTIKGTVINNETKLPLSNVNVINATRVIGTSTSGSGTFEIATKLNDTLLFSYIGYETVKVKVDKNTALSIENNHPSEATVELVVKGDTGLSMGYKSK